MSVLMGVVGSFVAIIAFSVLLETPGKYLWQTGVVGAIGGGVYLLCTHRGVDVVPDCRNPADRAGGRNVQNCLFYRCQ